MDSDLFNEIIKANQVENKVSFKKGEGSDPDNLGKSSVWVYDSEKFPFHIAEAYH